jgi:hypothetical protein
MSAGAKIDHIAPREWRDVAEQKWFFVTFGEPPATLSVMDG